MNMHTKWTNSFSMKQWQLNVLRHWKNVLSISHIFEKRANVCWTRCNDDDNFDFITLNCKKLFAMLCTVSLSLSRRLHFATFRRRYSSELITFYYYIELKADAANMKCSNDTPFIHVDAHFALSFKCSFGSIHSITKKMSMKYSFASIMCHVMAWLR